MSTKQVRCEEANGQDPTAGQPPPATVGSVLRSARIAAGLTQEALAEAMGVKQPTVSAWEADVNRLGPHRIMRLAGLLNLDAVELFLLGTTGEAVPA